MKPLFASIPKSFIPLLISVLWMTVFFSSGCKKEKNMSSPVLQTSTMTDRDGNVYKTVKIGDQWWMAEDLKVKTYRNGDSVSYKPGTVQWKDTAHGYCFISASSFMVGFLYNWYAVSDVRQLAPAGWHIPGDDEWQILEMTVGMSANDTGKVNWRGTNEGDKLKREKATAQIYGAWQDADNVFQVWPNNQSGFSALAGSCRLFNGTWGDPGPGGTGFWWSSTLFGYQPWYRYLDYNKSNIFRYHGDKRYGFSVRCVKD
ncbi:MAG: fibrobacter succinogenes major paralogous domain-containing protein [Bacteroidia bacterium]